MERMTCHHGLLVNGYLLFENEVRMHFSAYEN
jgi:hypothetical protein